jgi:hypothetical protein
MIESKRELMETGSDTTQPAMNIQLVNDSQKKNTQGASPCRRRRKNKRKKRPLFVHTRVYRLCIRAGNNVR